MNDREQVRALIKEEGNSYDFINVESGYECLLRRSPITGAWCGYVELPKDHPFHDMNYGELPVDISVHGGLTFSEDGIFGFDCSHYGDYYPMGFERMGYLMTLATQLSESFEKMIGGGAHDDAIPATYRDKEYAIKETNSMAKQFYSFRDFK